MFENITYESLVENKLAQVDPIYDKRPASLIRVAIMANSMESRLMYIDMEAVVRNMFPQTADREHLIMHAADFGIAPYAASQTVVKARFNIDIPVTARFNSPTGDVNFKTHERIGLEEDGNYYWLLKSEQYGYLSIEPIGRITPVNEINGLTLAEVVSVEIPGEEPEPTEAFRTRYEREKHWGRYGGNIADYRAMAHSISSVGGAKPVPTPNGVGGEVGIYIIDSAYNVPSQTLIDAVKEALDPVGFEGQGLGLAPIDHKVYVWPAEAITISITLPITFAAGYSWADVENEVTAAIEAYFLEIRREWETTNGATVYISQIETRIINALKDRLVDLQNTLLNGVASNIVLTGAQAPVLGTVTTV